MIENNRVGDKKLLIVIICPWLYYWNIALFYFLMNFTLFYLFLVVFIFFNLAIEIYMTTAYNYVIWDNIIDLKEGRRF